MEMSTGYSSFDTDKAIEAIVYTVEKARRDLYATLKLIYLADRCHLERYGRFMFGDWYSAMQSGPVPSGAYDLVKEAKRQTKRGANLAGALLVDEKHVMKTLRPTNLDELSKSDVECLDAAIATYGHMSGGQLKKLTHDAAYDATPLNGEIKMTEIARALGNMALVDHLSDPHPDRA